MRAFIKTTIAILLSIPLLSLATPVTWDFTSSVLQPLQSAWSAQIKGFYFTATSTTIDNTFPRYSATQGTTTNATSSRLYTTTFGINGEYFTDLTGTGLQNSSGILTLNATGDWTGTLDGYEGATLAQGNWIFDGSRLSPSTTVGIGVFASSTIGDGTGTGGLTISGTATTTNLKVTSLTASRAVFTNSSNVITTSAASAPLRNSLTDETGTGVVVFNSSPVFTGGSSFDGIIVTSSSSLANATATSLYTSVLGLNSEYFTDLTGTGLQNSSGVLTLNATGDWTGTFDGYEGAALLGTSNWINNGSRLSPSSTIGIGVFSSSTISDLSMTNSTSTNATSSRLYATLFGTNSEYFSDLTGFGLVNTAGSLGLTTTGAADGECLSYVSTGPALDWITCGGGGGGTGAGTATTTDTNNEAGEQITYSNNDFYVGGSASTTAEFNFDPETTTFTLSSTTANASATIQAVNGGLTLGKQSGESIEFNFNLADTVRLVTQTGVNIFSFGAIGLNASSATTTNLFSTLATFTNLVVNTLATFLNVVVTGLLDVGGGVLEIPNGTNPTIDSIGETAVDSTFGQFKYHDGTTTHVLTGTTTRAFNLSSTTKDALGNSFNTATSTFIISNSAEPVTLIGWYCKATTTGSVSVQFGDGTDWTSSATCSTGGVFYPSSNNTFNQFEDLQVRVGSSASAPSRVTISVYTSKTSQ